MDVIVAETADGYQLVTQPAHATLAGQFADHWGTARFDRPEPFTSLLVAAYAHDTGWVAYDRHPHLDSDGTPVDFREMPPETWIGLYDDGIDAVVEMDTYAGLLVSMHGAGLRNQRYGLSPEWPATPPEYRAFVDREHERQTRLCVELRDDGPLSESDESLLTSLHESDGVPEGYDGRLWADYRRLQVWDALSLSFCITDSPPGYGEVDSVPTAGPVAETTVSIDRVAPDEFRLDPYPFDTSPLALTVPTRTVRADAFEDEAGLVRAYYDAGRETRTVTLRRGDR